MSLEEGIAALAARIPEVLNDKAEDDEVVKLAGTQTITGAKTFSTAPQVPVGGLLANPVRRDDARLTDAREPLPHEHDGADITSGTIDPQRFPRVFFGGYATAETTDTGNNLIWAWDTTLYSRLFRITMSFDSTIAVPTGTPIDGQTQKFHFYANGDDRTLTFNAGFRLSTGIESRTFNVPQGQVLITGVEYSEFIDAPVIVAATVSEV